MGLHAQAFAAMPLRPALADVINDLLDEERTDNTDLTLFADFAPAESPQACIEDDAAEPYQQQGCCDTLGWPRQTG